MRKILTVLTVLLLCIALTSCLVDMDQRGDTSQEENSEIATESDINESGEETNGSDESQSDISDESDESVSGSESDESVSNSESDESVADSESDSESDSEDYGTPVTPIQDGGNYNYGN